MVWVLSHRRRVALAAGMVVALVGVGTMVSAHAFGGGGDHHQGCAMSPGPMGGGHGMMGGGRHGERMLDAAQVTKEQRTQIKQIMAAAEEEVRAQHASHRAQRDEWFKLLSQPKIDTGAVEKQRQQHLAQHDAISKRMTQAMLDAAAVLSPQQRVKWVEQMRSRADQMPRRLQDRGPRGGSGSAPNDAEK